MRKRRVTPIGAAFVALVLLVFLFVVRGALHRPAHVVLPQDASSSDVSDASLDDSAVGRIAVRPDTVQSAIATLERPARYSRAITIERYYSGGSGVDRSSVSVDGAWMRVDTEQASGAQSHTISNGERTWVWYGGSELYYESAAAFTADEEQGIPTYEDILRLDKKRIAAADYRLLDTVDCIFLETAADDGKKTPEGTIQKDNAPQTSNTILKQHQKSGSSPPHARPISDSDIIGPSNTSTPSRLSTDTPQGAINDHR